MIRSAIDLRKLIFFFVLEKEEFLLCDLFTLFSVKEKEKIHIHNYLKELCYFNYLQGIKQGNTTRYLKVKI